jgi:hypothetical protein
MANAKKSLSAGLDWYLISVDRLRKIGLVVLVLALAGATWWFLEYRTTNPRMRAQSAISDAASGVNSLAASKELESFRAEFDRATSKLSEARTFYSSEKYPQAEASAVESQTISRAVLARLAGERETDAQFLSVEGDVQFQKAATSDWRRADSRTPLFNGDWVKTGSSASAELIFSNGTLYTVGPNALLEIYAIANPGSSRKQNSIQMQIGSVEINTTDDSSTIRTPGSQVVVSSESVAQIGVDAEEKGTRVAALRGSAAVVSRSGEESVQLTSGETVRASAEGDLGAKRMFTLPPALTIPSDNHVVRGDGETTVELEWRQVASAKEYALQISRSRLFAGLEIDARREVPRANARVTSEGVFYWRVASVDAQGQIGPFSPFRRFRVVGVGTPQAQAGGIVDRTPPTLQLKRPFHIGGTYYLIEGRVEPGATLFINDDEAEVQPDGEFKKLVSFSTTGWNNIVVKAVDPAGNETVQTDRVHIRE